MDEQFFKDVAAEKTRLTRKALDTALINGRTDAAELMESPEIQEFLANQAIQAQTVDIGAPQPEREPISSGRRRAPKVSARKRQRQARKAARRG